jgi:hypothetical protein
MRKRRGCRLQGKFPHSYTWALLRTVAGGGSPSAWAPSAVLQRIIIHLEFSIFLTTTWCMAANWKRPRKSRDVSHYLSDVHQTPHFLLPTSLIFVRKGVVRTHAHPLVLHCWRREFMGQNPTISIFWLVRAFHRPTKGVREFWQPPFVRKVPLTW